MREKFHILTSGDDIPPPIPTFKVRTHEASRCWIEKLIGDHHTPDRT